MARKERMTKKLQLCLTDREYELVVAGAEKDRNNVSSYIRKLTLNALEGQKQLAG